MSISNREIDSDVRSWTNGGSGTGGSGGFLVCNLKYSGVDAGVLDKTWQEIYDAMDNNIPVLCKMSAAGPNIEEAACFISMIASVYCGGSKYYIEMNDSNNTTLGCLSPSDYPTFPVPEINSGGQQ